MTIKFGALRPGFTIEEAISLYLGKPYPTRDIFQKISMYQARELLGVDVLDGSMYPEDWEPLDEGTADFMDDSEARLISEQASEISEAMYQELEAELPTELVFLQVKIMDNPPPWQHRNIDYSESPLTRESLAAWFRSKGLETTVFDPPGSLGAKKVTKSQSQDVEELKARIADLEDCLKSYPAERSENNYLKTIGAMALAITESRRDCGSLKKPNVSAISRALEPYLPESDSGLADRTVRERISKGIHELQSFA